MKPKALYFRGICQGMNLPLTMKAITIVSDNVPQKYHNNNFILGIYYALFSDLDDRTQADQLLNESRDFSKVERVKKTLEKTVPKYHRLHKEAVYILGLARGADLLLTEKAVLLACQLHRNQFRDDGSDYVLHPLEICRYLIGLGIRDDVLLAAALLHDTVEDKLISQEDFYETMGEEVAELVEAVTKHNNETDDEYFAKIKEDVRAAIIKAADRTSNVGDMIKAFSIPRLKRYIEETEEKILPIMKGFRKMFLEYSDLFTLLRDRINNSLAHVKIILAEREVLEKEHKKFVRLRNKISTHKIEMKKIKS